MILDEYKYPRRGAFTQVTLTLATILLYASQMSRSSSLDQSYVRKARDRRNLVSNLSNL